MRLSWSVPPDLERCQEWPVTVATFGPKPIMRCDHGPVSGFPERDLDETVRPEPSRFVMIQGDG
jgi:hypothetical protein